MKKTKKDIYLREKIKRFTPQFLLDVYFWSKVPLWRKEGCPIPPPDYIKQQRVKTYSKMYNIDILVETGTYRGDMIAAVKHDFQKIYSIELSAELASMATQRFKRNPQVEVIQGDSGDLLLVVLEKLTGPTLFWLDAHYSGGITAYTERVTPVISELTSILEQNQFPSVILIDDARLFGTVPAYPKLEEIYGLVNYYSSNYMINIENDCICITPQ